jgi:hypothetical protein
MPFIFFCGFGFHSPDLILSLRACRYFLRACRYSCLAASPQAEQCRDLAIALAPLAVNLQPHRSHCFDSSAGSRPCFLALHRCCLQHSGQETMSLPLSVTQSDPHFRHAIDHLLVGGLVY